MINILKSGTKRKLTYVIIGLVILLLFFIFAINFAAKIIEINEIGYIDVYYKNLSTKIITGLVSFVILYIVFTTNLFFLRKNLFKIWETPCIMVSKKSPFILSALFSVITAIIVTLRISPLYLQFYSSVSFNISDPIFGQDIGYYIFQRPFLLETTTMIQFILFFQIVYSFAIYSISYLRTDFLRYKELFKEKKIMNHLLFSVVIYFISLIFSYKFYSENILFGTFGNNIAGAGFTDVLIWKNYYKVAPVVLLAVIVVSISFLKHSKIRLSAITLSIVPIFLIITTLTSLVSDVWFVKPYEVSMQRFYIQNNLNATKFGFNLNNITYSEFPADNSLTVLDIAENVNEINNIRVTDTAQTLAATTSLQGLKSYYSFNDCDIIPYSVNGQASAIMVSVREVDDAKLPSTSGSYISKKLRYTHGYGIVANSINTFNEEGQPEYIIKNIPVESVAGAPIVTQPRIYYGEKTNDYVLVGTKYSELDYSEGDKAVEYSYEGKAGIPLNMLNRIIFSVSKLDPMILFSDYVTHESKLLTNRNVLERVKTAAPFFTYDTDPYIVIGDDGSLKWVIDIYTTSDLYPCSQAYNGVNYIRNSAKAVVDAYDGTVKFYITDDRDPIIRVYSRMYPTLFTFEALPTYVAAQARYPEYIFNLQAEVYKTYHVSDPEALYSGSDIWTSSREKYSQDETVDVVPYYNVMDIGYGSELTIMQPFTPRGKETLVAWMAAGSQPGNYGNLKVYTFPKGKTVYGTLHVENKIDNDPAISKEISLWNQGGSKVIKGNLLVVPVNNSLLYVEPIYVTAKNSAALPEVKRVVVCFEDKVVMEENLQKALEVLFASVTPVATNNEEDNVNKLIRDAVLLYNELEEHSASGDFEAFGKTLDKLGDILKEIDGKTSSNN